MRQFFLILESTYYVVVKDYFLYIQKFKKYIKKNACHFNSKKSNVICQCKLF